MDLFIQFPPHKTLIGESTGSWQGFTTFELLELLFMKHYNSSPVCCHYVQTSYAKLDQVITVIWLHKHWLQNPGGGEAVTLLG